MRKPSSLFFDLKSLIIEPGCILSGFDFPIGIPSAYAAKVGIPNFLSALPLFGQREWANFYIPADTPDDIALHRPFYPARPGFSKRLHLAQGLGIPFEHLYRLCENAPQNRRSACPLFWTMGAQQVGKAAISGWKDLLSPALEDLNISLKIWPFSGNLQQICKPGNIVVVETYPAEFYGHLGLSFSSPVRRSKRRQSDRKAFSPQLIAWAVEHNLDIADSIIDLVSQGFEAGPVGEDQFDAFVGLYGMMNAILESHAIGEPLPPQITKIEGWIFGQQQPTNGI
ncbi:MAG: hypothetical protein WAV05_12540 [Anaerolineales bacterium]